MIDKRWRRRQSQRKVIYWAGILFLGAGALCFVGTISLSLLDAYIDGMTELALVSMASIALGAILSAWFSRIGWHPLRIQDFVLNQLSVGLVLLGILVFVYDAIHNGLSRLSLAAVGLALAGLILSHIGMRRTPL